MAQHARWSPWRLAALGSAVLWLVYIPVWYILPSADDYNPPLAEYFRGEARGPLSFFTEPSAYPFYRPLTFMLTWLAGRMSLVHIVPLMHAIHLLAGMACIVALVLWVRRAGLSERQAMVAVGVFVVHPVLAGPVGSIDGFQRLLAFAFAYLAAVTAVSDALGGTQRAVAAGVLLLCGLGFAEYALCGVPLAFVAVAAFGERQSVADRVKALVGIAAAALLWYAARSHVLAAHSGDMLVVEPAQVLRNVVLLAMSVLYLGNTASVVLGDGAARLWAGAASAAAATGLLLSLYIAGRRQVSAGSAKPLMWGLASMGASLFPMVLVTHVSELYATGLLIALAACAGVAWSALEASGKAARVAAAIGGCAVVVICVRATWQKLAGLESAGVRAQVQLAQLLEAADGHEGPVRIAMGFDTSADTPEYSVFVHNDVTALQPGHATAALQWMRPGTQGRVDHVWLDGKCDGALTYDVVLAWDAAGGRFRSRTDLSGTPLCPIVTR